MNKKIGRNKLLDAYPCDMCNLDLNKKDMTWEQRDYFFYMGQFLCKECLEHEKKRYNHEITTSS